MRHPIIFLVRSASSLRGHPELNLAGKLSGDRSTSLRVVGLLIQIATTVDLSDNTLTDDEALTLASSVRQATKMTKFVLQSPSLTDTGVRALQEALSACPADVATVDLPALKDHVPELQVPVCLLVVMCMRLISVQMVRERLGCVLWSGILRPSPLHLAASRCGRKMRLCGTSCEAQPRS